MEPAAWKSASAVARAVVVVVDSAEEAETEEGAAEREWAPVWKVEGAGRVKED